MEPIIHINLGQSFDYSVTYYKEISEKERQNRRGGSYYRTQENKLYVNESGKLADLLVSEQPRDSYFGSSSGNKIDPNVRSSKSYTTQLKSDPTIFLDALKRIAPEYLHPAIKWDSCKYTSLLVYREGDFFKKHTDTKSSKHHYATVLLYPPATFTGGVLEIEKPDNTVFRFEGSPTDWNLIIFEPTLKHQCSEITSGERYVFKMKASYDEYLYKYYRAMISPTEIPENLIPKKKEQVSISDLVKSAKEEMKKAIDELNESDFNDHPDDYSDVYQALITSIQGEWEKVRDKIIQPYQSTNSQVEYVLKTLKSENAVVKFVVLESFYHDPIPANLYDSDLEILRAVKKEYPKAYLKNIPVKIKEDSYDDCDLHQEYISGTDSWLGPGDKLNAVITVSGMDSGELVSKSTEYNDSTYDPVYHRNYTCIVIVK
jgi:hypothetical protein